jgi:hypothetical protein
VAASNDGERLTQSQALWERAAPFREPPVANVDLDPVADRGEALFGGVAGANGHVRR